MCGILGVYSPNFSSPEFDIFEKLLFLNVFRGSDSTGIVRIERNKSLKTRKSLLPSPAFIGAKESDIIRDIGTAAEKPMGLIGHTRSATKGAVSLKNAHPFMFDNVTGVHNGTIHTSFKHRAEYDTDSEALYRNINDYGLEEALNNANAYDSAWALAFVDKKERTLNFVRNDKRPLYFTYIFGVSTIIWSSERLALEYVLKHKSMHSNKGWRGDDKIPYFTLNPNELMTIKLGETPGNAEITKLKVEEKKTPGPATGATTSTGISGSQFTQGEWKKIGSGYEWVPKRPTILSLVQDSKKLTSTSTAITSVTPQTEKSKSGDSDPEYEDCKTTYGVDGLKNLAWLKPGKEEGAPWVEGGEVEEPEDDYIDPNEDVTPEKALEIAKATGGFMTAQEAIEYERAFGKNQDAKKGLPELDWKEPGKSVVPFDGPYKEDTLLTFSGYQGIQIKASEFRQRLKEGCFACSESLNLDDPHQFEAINGIHWWTREYWACDYCFKHSDGDWVRCTIEDDWSMPGHPATK